MALSVSSYGYSDISSVSSSLIGNAKNSCCGTIKNMLKRVALVALPLLIGAGVGGIMLACGLPIALVAPVAMGVGIIGLLVLGVIAVKRAKAKESLRNEPLVTYTWDSEGRFVCER